MIYLAGIRFTDYPSVQIRFVFWLVRQDEKMFVTDIDGTITKSDMSGFLLPKLGVDHHHSGTPYCHLCIHINNVTFVHFIPTFLQMYLDIGSESFQIS